jgi:hypothetical protein
VISRDDVHRNQACGHLQDCRRFLLGRPRLQLALLLGDSRRAQDKQERPNREESDGISRG